MMKISSTGWTQRVKLPTTQSIYKELHQAVPQGKVLGYSLFNFHVKSLQNKIERPTQLLHYAGDTLLFATVEKAEISIKQFEEVLKE